MYVNSNCTFPELVSANPKTLDSQVVNMSAQKDRRLLDEVRDYMRLHYYSIHTERTYCEWIRKYILGSCQRKPPR